MDDLPAENLSKIIDKPGVWKKFVFLFIASWISLAILVWLYFITGAQNSSSNATYTLRCGQKTLNSCTLSQLKFQDNFSLRIDVTAAFAKYKDQKPDLCYYTNIEPARKFVPFQKITIQSNILYGDCLKNVYDLYKKNSQFAFTIDGQLTQGKLQAKAFLAPASISPIETRITKEAQEVFNLQ